MIGYLLLSFFRSECHLQQNHIHADIIPAQPTYKGKKQGSRIRYIKSHVDIKFSNTQTKEKAHPAVSRLAKNNRLHQRNQDLPAGSN